MVRTPVVDVQRKEITGSMDMEVVRFRSPFTGDEKYYVPRFEKLTSVLFCQETGASPPIAGFVLEGNVILIDNNSVTDEYFNFTIFGR